MLDGLFARLRSVVRRDTVAEEMEEELREHLERATELHIRRGLSPDEARLAARRDLGNTTIVADEARAAWGGFSLDDLRRDVRHGIRALLRTPGFSVVVIITLAFGFGVNGAMLGMVRGALNLSPVPQPETWVRVPGLWSNAAYEYLRDSVHSLTGLSASAQQSVLVRAGNGQAAEEVSATFVSGNFFDELQGRPILGRTFGADEIAPPAGEPVVIVGHRFWMRRLAGDSGAIGAVLRLGSGQAFTVIGVMPRTFTGGSPRGPDLWLPLGARTRLPGDGDQVRSFGDDSWFGPTGREFLFLSGRIAQGRSFEEVRTELRLRVGQIARADDSTLAGSIAANLSTAQMSAMAKGEEAVVAVLILAIPVCVLLIASVTVANLMLARAATRRREMGIQVALGASRSRVIRAWLTECLVLGGTAAGLGLLLSFAAVRGVTASRSLWPADLPIDMDVLASRFAPDLAVVVYLAVLVVVATLVFGLTPILRSTTGDPLSSIRDGGLEPVRRDRVRLRSALVVAQVAVTMVLLVAAGMLLRGIVHIARVDPGFDRQDVMVVRPGLALGGYDSARAHTFGDELQARLQAVPGVQATARGTAPLMNGALATVTHPGEPSEAARGGQFNMVSESWFETLGIAIERGRAFTAEEVRQEAPVAILSATTARTLFPGEEALGKIVTIRVTRPSGPTAAPEGPSSNAAGRFEAARVVGIAADAQVSRIGIVNRRYAYVPGNQGDLVVRRRPADAAAIDERIRTLSREIDPDVVLWTRSMEQVIRNSHGFIAIAPLVTAIGAVIGGLSLALAIVGLFGLTAYAVEQRRREFGVRMALGAEASSVVRLVAGQSLRLVAIGALVGVAGAVAGGGVLRRLIFGVRAVDPIAYGAVALLLAIVAFLACWIPARRATRVDPMVALRVD